MYWPNLKSVALPVPEIIAIEILGGVQLTPNRGEVAAVWSGMVGLPFEKASMSSYMDSIVTFPLPRPIGSARFRDVIAFLQARHFSPPCTSSFPKFPHVPLEVGR